MRNPIQTNQFADRMKKLEGKCFGTVINNFYDLELAYADYTRNELGKKHGL
jgi:hypothetical protein